MAPRIQKNHIPMLASAIPPTPDSSSPSPHPLNTNKKTAPKTESDVMAWFDRNGLEKEKDR